MYNGRVAERERALRRFKLVALWIPLALFAVIAAVQFVLIPQLPDPAAVHWNGAGDVDGFGPAWSYPVLTLVAGGGIVALTAGISLTAARSSSAVDFRFMSATNLWLVGFLGSLSLSLMVAQVGLDDARAASGVLWPLALGFLLGLVLGVIGWRATIVVPDDGASGRTPEPVDLAPNEKAVWLQTVTMSRVGLVVLGGALLSCVAVVIVAAFVEAPGALWITVATVVLLALLMVLLTVFRVRVDETGLTVRAAVGWPGIHIARQEIRSAEVVRVNPMGEYGGWGWRFSPTHGQGVVLRTGDALRVTRTDGRPFTVTVDDAETAAALLGGYQKRDAF
ncbi:DUF1648 domain-containing protein [Tessaracoccus sp. OS52]|uniref:DUF1648 domain-containing protein n=1 Tax=Tessaracoccus sp. OS52 TaxID=2886691 RepID=UPI001D0F941A|nr:DUF1648 domain-containing protein [Tessaracoccus sp. OS52]MCC2593925.1 DUF1648 domain-containing protein [Tessaracoccus sp. OS52]